MTELIAPAWTETERSHPRDASWRARHGLPSDRKIVALPLDYDHPGNLFGIHRSVRPNRMLVASLADRVHPPLFLAITDHPLNDRFVDNGGLIEALDARRHVARLLPPGPVAGGITTFLAQHADGMIVGDSKSFAAAASSSERRSCDFRSSPADPGCGPIPILAGLRRIWQRAKARPQTATKRCCGFAFYLANEAFAPREADVSGTELRIRIERPVDPARWPAAFARILRVQAGPSDQWPLEPGDARMRDDDRLTFPPPGALTGPTVQLVPLEAGHREPLRDAAGLDESIWDYFPRTFNGAGEDFDRWFDHTRSRQRASEHYPFAVVRRADGRILGTTPATTT
ncbi:MAG: hypothetical protein WDN44_15905 [Sphingomonas sp.]